MKITYTTKYNQDYKKIIIKKNMIKEKEKIEKIKDIIIASNNLHELLLNPYSKIYGFSQKHGNLKEIITAKINNKLRLWLKPVGNYPYNYPLIIEIEFLSIDNKHYGEG